jgi:hypothetical protein
MGRVHKNKKSNCIAFTTPEKKRKERVAEAIGLYQSEIETVAINADKWQNKKDEKSRDKKGSKKSRKVAGRPRRYKLPEEGISGEDTRLGGEVHGVREGTSEYGPSEADVLNAVMEWKQRRKHSFDKAEVAKTIRNLASLGLISVRSSKDLPVAEEVLV